MVERNFNFCIVNILVKIKNKGFNTARIIVKGRIEANIGHAAENFGLFIFCKTRIENFYFCGINPVFGHNECFFQKICRGKTQKFSAAVEAMFHGAGKGI